MLIYNYTYHPSISCVALLFLLASQAIAQPVEERFKNFYVQDGLSQNSSMALLQDSHGFLWIGTQAGLNRFDGYEFNAYRNIMGDSTSLKDEYIRTLFEDSNQIIWVGTKSGGLHRFNESMQSFTRYDLIEMLGYSVTEEGTTPNDVAKIVEAAPQKYWIGTAAGLVFFDAEKEQMRLVDYGVPSVSRINDMLINAEGDLWIADEGGHAVRIESLPPMVDSDENGEIMLSLDVPMHAMYGNQDGDVFIGTFGKGMYRYEASQNHFEQPVRHLDLDLPSDSITVIYSDNDTRFWVGFLNRGLSLIYHQDNIRHFTYDPSNPYSIADNAVVDVLIDRTGVIWIGTWDGLSRLSPSFEAFDLFVHSDEEGGLSFDRVVSFEEEGAGIYWVGTYGGGLFRYDANRSYFDRFTASGAQGDLCGNDIFDLDIDEDNLLWIASLDDGLCFLDLNDLALDSGATEFITFLHEPENPKSLRDNELQSVFASRDGSIWVGLYNTGLDRLDKETGEFHHYDDSSDRGGLTSKQIWPIIEDQSGDLWIGAFEGGLLRYTADSAKDFKSIVLDDGNTSSNRIYDLYLDSNQNLWVATDDGAKKIDLSTMEVVTLQVDDGLVHENVRAIVEDDYGKIWLSTNSGISRYTPETNSFTNFYIEDGLQGNRFYARSAMKMSDGRLFFGGSNGFNIIHPERINDDAPESTILLNQLLVNNLPFDQPEQGPTFLVEELEFEHYENRLHLSFATLDYTNLGYDKYRYRLMSNSNLGGFSSTYLDTNWIDLGIDNFVGFQALPFGEYQLQVTSLNKNGQWNHDGLYLAIKIKTPWYAQWWFRGLLFFGIIGVVTGVLLLRTRYLLNIERMKTDALLGIERMRVKIAQGLHDDVGANMATIAMRLGMMSNKSDLPDEDRKKMKELSTMVRQTGQTIRETGWIINVKYDDLRKLVNQMRELAYVMLDSQIKHTFNEDPNPMPEDRIDMEFKQNFYLLYKEALNNASKYSQASKIHISIHYKNDTLLLGVADDGIGFCKDKIKEGSGLGNMSSRAQEMGGILKIDSKPGVGTTITLEAPIQLNEDKRSKKTFLLR